MSGSLRRPAKRRKLSADEPALASGSPSSLRTLKATLKSNSSPLASSRSLITYGSSKKLRGGGHAGLLARRKPGVESIPPDPLAAPNAASTDSAYHSMSAGTSDGERIAFASIKGREGRPHNFASNDGSIRSRIETTSALQQTPKKRGQRKPESTSKESTRDWQQEAKSHSEAEDEQEYTQLVSKAPELHRTDSDDELQVSATLSSNDGMGAEPGGWAPIRSSGRQRRPTQRVSSARAAVPTPTKSPGRKRGRPRKTSIDKRQEKGMAPHMRSDDTPRKPNTATVDVDGDEQSVLVDETAKQSFDQSLPKLQYKKSIIEDDARSDTVALATSPKVSQSLKGHLRDLKSMLQDEQVSKSFEDLKNQILDGLTGKRRLPLVGLEEEYQKVHQLVQQTVVAGEGNSLLVIGARGTAKTALVETVLSELAEEHSEDFHVVRLNGFIHTDDKLALKEIWRQLGREMEVDDDTMGVRSNYADILTSLLALLSHPAEHSNATGETVQTSKSVVFLMDEFDLFATHSRQTLLYNLFDIAQSRKAPIAVLGLTTRVNVVESLEKRVKSRFSHRYVYLSLPKSFSQFREICKSALLCDTLDAQPVTSPSSTENRPVNPLRAAWSKYTSAILTEDPTVTQLLRRIYAHTKSVPDIMAAFLLPIMSMSSVAIPTAANFIASALLPPDSKLHLLRGLSELELALLISAARLDVILDTDTCNFNMTYDEYLNLASRAKMLSSASGAAALGGAARVWSREVAMGAWERLEFLELLVPVVGTGGGGGMADVGRVGRLWKVDVGLEEIGASRLDMSSVMTRWCKEI